MLQKSDAFKKQIKRTMMNRMYFKEYNSNLLANEKTYFAPVGSSKESRSAKNLPLVISHVYRKGHKRHHFSWIYGKNGAMLFTSPMSLFV